jgi:NADH-quinone oxidoreductase subunit K
MGNEGALLVNSLILGGLLFCIGLIGFLARRNMIVMFLATEMMLQGIAISLIAFGRYHNDWGGQILVIFILTVAACEAAVALGLLVALYQRSGSLDVAVWQNLREDNLAPYVDANIPEPADLSATKWPSLTPAGVEPAELPDADGHRPKVDRIGVGGPSA